QLIIVPDTGPLDVGVVQLFGSGRIAGRLQLPDGTPLGNVTLGVIAIDQDAVGGNLDASQDLGDDGRFEFDGLAPGQYEFYALSPAPIEILRPREVAAGTEGFVVEANALILTLQCQRDGIVVPITYYQRKSLEKPRARRRPFHFSGNSQGFSPAVQEHTVPVSASERFGLRGVDPDGRSYYGLVEPGLPLGRHDIDLMPEHAAYSIVRFRIDEPVDGSAIQVRRIERSSGLANVVFQSSTHSEGNGEWLELALTADGAVSFHLSLAAAGSRILADPVVDLSLRRARRVDTVLRTVEGGGIEVSVDGDALAANASTSNGNQPPRFASCFLRMGPDDEWEQMPTLMPGNEASVVFRSVHLGGDALRSMSMRPGTYELKVTCEGYRDHIQVVVIEPGVTAPYSIQLLVMN
ncbi:MAG: prealbumin-like fold domain-containing protein, partial [Planctomycetota bacterium]